MEFRLLSLQLLDGYAQENDIDSNSYQVENTTSCKLVVRVV